jgi:TetR/AcrR family transcriptional regulator
MPATAFDAGRAPRASKSEATKSRILEAAETEFAAKGFDGARLGNIARAAGVQQALIHHYFHDKAGLHRDVITRALAAMTAEGWDILERLAPVKQTKRMDEAALRALAEAFADLLVRFYSTHAAVFALLRHEAQRSGELSQDALVLVVRPQFDEIVKRLEKMRARGEIRRDVHPRHLCISIVGMACFPFQEEHFVASLWPTDTRAPEFAQARKKEIVEMVMARVLP